MGDRRVVVSRRGMEEEGMICNGADGFRRADSAANNSDNRVEFRDSIATTRDK